jgi:hypothetical protein
VSFDGGSNTALVLRILRAIVIGAQRRRTQNEAGYICCSPILSPKAKTLLATQGESIYSKLDVRAKLRFWQLQLVDF